MASPKKSRNWTITWNNKSIQQFEAAVENYKDNIRYVIAQAEVGAETGTPHIQAYVQFITSRALSYPKRIWEGGHFEMAKGTPRQNIEYCTKPETRAGGLDYKYEYGEARMSENKGQRNDLLQAKHDIEAGMTIEVSP